MAQLSDDERTNPLGLFNYARSYWRSAEHLNAARLKVTHPHAPVTFLYCHALELYLKAYLRAAGRSLADLKKFWHLVARLAEAAAAAGLKLDSDHAEVLSHVEDADVAIEARYIETGFKKQPTEEALSGVAEALDREIAAYLKAKGHHVRDEQFHRPEPQRDNKLDEDTTRILLHLFRQGERSEETEMADTFRLERNVLRYHLDLLEAAKLAEQSGFNYVHGHIYWVLTSQGRRYVIEHGLNR